MRQVFVVCLVLMIVSAAPARADGLKFSIGTILASGQELWYPALLLEGSIQPGDSARFMQFLRGNRSRVVDELLPIVVDSPGGSVSEALKIAEIVKTGMFSVNLPPNLDKNTRQAKCASSCFLLVAAAPSRVVSKSTVGLHRPFFDPSIYAASPAAKAMQAHELAIGAMRKWLEENGVPQGLIEKMMRTSSREIYWMTEEDARLLGEVSASAEELMIAKCNFERTLFDRWGDAVARNLPSKQKLDEQLAVQSKCTRAVMKAVRATFLSTSGP